MHNLRRELGGRERSPRILMKRDDLTGLAFGGNKARKLEFLVGDALREGATVLVTSGAAQSNHARMTTAAARAAGLKIALVLTKDRECPVVQGNLFLDELSCLAQRSTGLTRIQIPLFATGAEEAAKIAEVIAELEKRAERPYLIPIGGSSPRGSFGYVTGTLELVTQLFQNGEAPSRLYFPNGSRGTQAGLALGAKMYSAPYRIYGIAVSGGEPEKTQRAIRIASEAAEILGVASKVTAQDLINDENYIGTGYGIATPGCVEAIRLLAGCEGILLDPVYTGKAMAGMIDHIRRGDIDPGETVVFLHTGGTPALFAHLEDFGFR